MFFFLLFGPGACCFFLLFGRGTGVHSLTRLPGSSLSDPTTKETEQQKQKHGFHQTKRRFQFNFQLQRDRVSPSHCLHGLEIWGLNVLRVREIMGFLLGLGFGVWGLGFRVRVRGLEFGQPLSDPSSLDRK